MKKLTFLILTIAIAFVGCKKDDDVAPTGSTGSGTVSPPISTDVSGTRMDGSPWVMVQGQATSGANIFAPPTYAHSFNFSDTLGLVDSCSINYENALVQFTFKDESSIVQPGNYPLSFSGGSVTCAFVYYTGTGVTFETLNTGEINITSVDTLNGTIQGNIDASDGGRSASGSFVISYCGW